MKKPEQNITNLSSNAFPKKWLAELPELIVQIKATYELSALTPVKNLSYNYVLSGFKGNQPIILKLGPDIDGLKREAVALRAFTGFGVVKTLAASDGMILLEHAVSGISLKSYFPEKDNDAIRTCAECLKRLHEASIPHTHTFPHIKDWLAVLDKDWEIPTPYLKKARQLRDSLLQTSTKDVLLHGDLHHDNILQQGNDWVVIDPKGVIGEHAYEVAAFIRNPIPKLLEHDIAGDIIDNRIARFSKILALPAQRILDWCFVQAVLSWIWTVEDLSPEAFLSDDASSPMEVQGKECDNLYSAYFKQLTKLFYEREVNFL
jgi:streptomycin 6-kinase